MKTMSLDAFKEKIGTDIDFVNSLTDNGDSVDFESGLATIHRANLNKFLEEYFCKSEEDLSDTLYYRYGVFAKIVD